MAIRNSAFLPLIVLFSLLQLAHADPATSSGAPPSTSTTTAPPSASAPAAPPVTTPAAPAAKPQEESYSYVSGYSDGCATANLRYARQAHVKPARDPKLYDSDNDYRSGWDHGYRKCEDKVTPGGIAIPGNSVVM